MASSASPNQYDPNPVDNTFVAGILSRANPAILSGMTAPQREELQRLVGMAAGRPGPKLVDLRFSVPLGFTKVYVVMLLGRDRRGKARPRAVEPAARIGNLVAAAYLILTLGISIAAIVNTGCGTVPFGSETTLGPLVPEGVPGAEEPVNVNVIGGHAAIAVALLNPLSGPAPLSVQFDATQSVPGSGDQLTYHWQFSDGFESDQPSGAHVFNAPGEYFVTLVVTDASGGSASAQARVVVEPPAAPPSDTSTPTPDAGSSAQPPGGENPPPEVLLPEAPPGEPPPEMPPGGEEYPPPQEPPGDESQQSSEPPDSEPPPEQPPPEEPPPQMPPEGGETPPPPPGEEPPPGGEESPPPPPGDAPPPEEEPPPPPPGEEPPPSGEESPPPAPPEPPPPPPTMLESIMPPQRTFIPYMEDGMYHVEDGPGIPSATPFRLLGVAAMPKIKNYGFTRMMSPAYIGIARSVADADAYHRPLREAAAANGVQWVPGLWLHHIIDVVHGAPDQPPWNMDNTQPNFDLHHPLNPTALGEQVFWNEFVNRVRILAQGAGATHVFVDSENTFWDNREHPFWTDENLASIKVMLRAAIAQLHSENIHMIFYHPNVHRTVPSIKRIAVGLFDPDDENDPLASVEHYAPDPFLEGTTGVPSTIVQFHVDNGFFAQQVRCGFISSHYGPIGFTPQEYNDYCNAHPGSAQITWYFCSHNTILQHADAFDALASEAVP